MQILAALTLKFLSIPSFFDCHFAYFMSSSEDEWKKNAITNTQPREKAYRRRWYEEKKCKFILPFQPLLWLPTFKEEYDVVWGPFATKWPCQSCQLWPGPLYSDQVANLARAESATSIKLFSGQTRINCCMIYPSLHTRLSFSFLIKIRGRKLRKKIIKHMLKTTLS